MSQDLWGRGENQEPEDSPRCLLCLSVCLYVQLSLSVSAVNLCLSLHLCLGLSVCLWVCLLTSVCVSVCLYLSLSFSLCACVSLLACLSVCLSVCLHSPAPPPALALQAFLAPPACTAGRALGIFPPWPGSHARPPPAMIPARACAATTAGCRPDALG